MDYTITILNCARCSGDHKDMGFKKLTVPIKSDDGIGPDWTHWSLCPILKEPVLLMIKDVVTYSRNDACITVT